MDLLDITIHIPPTTRSEVVPPALHICSLHPHTRETGRRDDTTYVVLKIHSHLRITNRHAPRVTECARSTSRVCVQVQVPGVSDTQNRARSPLLCAARFLMLAAHTI